MLQVIIKLIGAILVLLGIILVYDARILTKKFFGFGDQNEATQRIKDFRFFGCDCWRINFIFCVNLLDKSYKNVLILISLIRYADVAELVDALVLGTSVNDVGVRVPSSAPLFKKWLKIATYRD